MSLACFWTLFKWNHEVFALSCLTSFACYVFEAHPSQAIAPIVGSFHCWILFHCSNIPHTLILWFGHCWAFEWFPIWDNSDLTAVNIHLHIWWAHIRIFVGLWLGVKLPDILADVCVIQMAVSSPSHYPTFLSVFTSVIWGYNPLQDSWGRDELMDVWICGPGTQRTLSRVGTSVFSSQLYGFSGGLRILSRRLLKRSQLEPEGQWRG